MNSLLNEQYIRAQAAAGRRMQLFGMLMVLASFVCSFFLIENPLLVFLSYPLLIVGFPMWQVGRGRNRRWTDEAKMAPIVAAELKGVSTKHMLFSFVLLPDGTLIDHLIVGPDGFYVVEMRAGGFPVTATVTEKGERWSEKLPFLERLARLGEEALGNPSKELETSTASLKKWLVDNKLAPEDVPVYGVIVFRESRTTLDLGDTAFEALRLDELKSFVLTPLPEEEQGSGTPLPTDDRNRVNTALRELIGAPTAPAPATTRTSQPASSSSRTSQPATGARPATPTKVTTASPRARTTQAPSKRSTNGSRKSS